MCENNSSHALLNHTHVSGEGGKAREGDRQGGRKSERCTHILLLIALPAAVRRAISRCYLKLVCSKAHSARFAVLMLFLQGMVNVKLSEDSQR